uniref:Copper chaperone CopZ n=1 Tax=Candidatus Kentrum eta TaxID=2126337 RepID=A0A450UWE1_9GAMM|nr:MAG: Copper chaperone CopZ [Candidatus Kentron sp. H]VFJ96842.1 MAG: Copper chaperone CopZ [Candidatus Kentron sp. H]VFK02615.1 MAG: Copper chaperone CopZ [Candidatus Kentron sp. H]
MTSPQCDPPVKRTIRVTGMSRVECEQAIQRGLNDLPGVHEARADHRTGRVKVAYDLDSTRIRTVEEKLVALGYPLADGFWARQKRRWVHFTEQNRRDNLAQQGHCCSKTPL